MWWARCQGQKKQGNHQKWFSFVVGSCERFRSSGVQSIMSVESVIEELQRITKEKEVQRSEHKRKEEEEI